MNSYNYSDLEIGHKEMFDAIITEDKMKKFYDITGDDNPLHTNDEFAKKRGFKGMLSYGFLTASFMSKLVGIYLPGEKCIEHKVEQTFLKPVFVNDKLTIIGTVTEKNDTFQLITIKVEMRNQNNEKVLRGKMKVGFLHELN